MSRFAVATAVALLLVAAASAMPMIPAKPYCNGPFVLMPMQNLLTLWVEGTPDDCKIVYQYSLNSTGFAVLNQVAEESCYGQEGSVTMMQYDAARDVFHISAYRYPNSGSMRSVDADLTPCGASSSSVMATGQYCSDPTTSMMVYQNYFMWVQPDPMGAAWNNGYCALAGEYDLSSSYSLSFTDRATSCSSGSLSIQRNFYDANSKELWIQYYGAGITNQAGKVLAQSTCNSTQGYIPQWASYCVDASAAASDYQSSVFMSQNMSNLQVIAPNAGRGIDCHATYNYSMWNGQIALNLTSDNTCSGYAPNLFGAKYFTSNDSFVLLTYDRDWFTASRCAATTGLVNGTYCGGDNAQMQVAGQTLSIWSDWDEYFPRCRLNAQWRLTEGGAIITKTESTCGATDLTLTMNGTTVYVTYQRSNGIVEGYAFEQDFCGTATAMPVQALPVPAGKYCMNVESAGGASGMFIVDNKTFGWTVNTTNTPNSWINGRGPCGYAGHVSHRNGRVSYHVDMSACSGSSYTPSIRLYNMTFVNGALTFMLYQNERSPSANMTVTTSMCAASTGSLLPATEYCPAYRSMYDVSKMHVTNNSIFFTSWTRGCFVVARMNWRTDNMIYVTSEIDSCSGTISKSFAVLANGDLYFHNNNGYGSAGAMSSTSCGPTYVNPTITGGQYCGVFGASSGATPAPTAPAGNTSVSLQSGQTSTTMGAKLTLGFSSTGVAFWVIEPENDTPCIIAGGITPYATSIGFGASNATSNCAYWQIKQILRNPTTNELTVAIQQNSYAWVNATLALNSCAAWQSPTGLAGGEYCLAQGQMGTTSAFWTGYSPFLAAGTYGLWFDATSSYPRTIIANFTSNSTASNQTATSQWWWDYSSWTITVPDRYVNKVGTTGLSVSGRFGSLAYTAGQCTANSNMSTAPMSLSSANIPEIQGRIQALFVNGTYFMMWNGSATYASEYYERRCYVQGFYTVANGQVSLLSGVRESSDCGSAYEFSQVTMAADGSISFTLQWKNMWIPVTLTSANCALVPAGVPAGRYCESGSTEVYICNNNAFVVMTTPYTASTVAASNIMMGAILNITQYTNGTLGFLQKQDAYLNWPFSATSVGRWTLGIYDANSKTIQASNYINEYLTWVTQDSCVAWPQRFAMSAYPTPGAYCGYSSLNSTSKMTFIVGAMGTFYASWNQKDMTSSTTTTFPKCYMTGILKYSTSTKLVNLFTQHYTSGCNFGNSASSWSSSRVKFTGAMYFNDSTKIQLYGGAWTTAAGTSQPITYVLSPANCAPFAAQDSTVARFTPYIPTGAYETMAPIEGAMAGAATVVVGNEYATSTYRSGIMAMNGGTYQPVFLEQRSQQLPFVPMSYFNQITFANTTFNTSTLVLNVDSLWSSGGSYLTLPQAYIGKDPASRAASAAADAADKASEEDKKKTGIIIGVIIGVVAVIAIIAIVAMKSRGGSSQPSPMPGGQDYRPMNSV